MCGETETAGIAVNVIQGLSPHVRGNLTVLGARDHVVGPIPACAGKPFRASFRSAWERAYPRMCGETYWIRRAEPNDWGLSPHVRGNQSRAGVLSRGAGPIPACAGKPRRGGRRFVPIRAYPRMCGETYCR